MTWPLFLLATFLFAIFLAGWWFSPLASADETGELSSQLSVVSLSPEVLQSNEDLTLTIELADSVSLTDYDQIEVFMRPTPFVSNLQMNQYLEGEDFPGWGVYSSHIDSDAWISISGNSNQLTMTIPANELPEHQAQTTGSRGITVVLSSSSNDSITLETRGVVIYAPITDVPQTEVNVIGFDLSSSQTSSKTLSEELFHLTSQEDTEETEFTSNAEQPVISDLAVSLAKIPGVSLAVLPQFLEDTETLNAASDSTEGNSPSSSSESSATPNSTSSATATEVTQNRQQLAHNRTFLDHRDKILEQGVELVSLPTQNSDLSLLGATNSTILFSLGLSTRAIDTDLVDLKNSTQINNIVFSSNDGFTLNSLNQLKGNTLLAPSGWNLLEQTESSLTPTSKVQISTETGDLSSDEDQENSIDVIGRWATGDDLLNQPVGSAADELLIRQKLRTAIILVGLEDPSDTRTLSNVLDISRNLSVDSAAISARVDALLNNPWTVPVGISSVVDSVSSTIAREPVSATNPSNSTELAALHTEFSKVGTVFSLAAEMAQTTSISSKLVKAYTDSAFSPTRFDLSLSQRETLTTQAVSQMEPIVEAIKVVAIDQVNVLNRSANFPVTVVNSGSEAVSVEVSLVPNDVRLQSQKSVVAEVPAESQVRVEIPVTAVGSGDVQAKVQVSTLGGTLISSSAAFSVRVRADWEDTGTIVAGTALLLLFLFGIVRTVYKGRRRSDPVGAASPSYSVGIVTQHARSRKGVSVPSLNDTSGENE